MGRARATDHQAPSPPSPRQRQRHRWTQGAFHRRVLSPLPWCDLLIWRGSKGLATLLLTSSPTSARAEVPCRFVAHAAPRTGTAGSSRARHRTRGLVAVRRLRTPPSPRRFASSRGDGAWLGSCPSRRRGRRARRLPSTSAISTACEHDHEIVFIPGRRSDGTRPARAGLEGASGGGLAPSATSVFDLRAFEPARAPGGTCARLRAPRLTTWEPSTPPVPAELSRARGHAAMPLGASRAGGRPSGSRPVTRALPRPAPLEHLASRCRRGAGRRTGAERRRRGYGLPTTRSDAP